jgi:hypothetical protein
MYESRHQPPLSRDRYIRRVVSHVLCAIALVMLSLAAGMLGYHALEHLPWLDAFLNASMLLGGMGPVDPPHTEAGKLFAGLYALYAGLVFLVTAAIVFAPILHRILHRFHWSEKL